MGTPGTFGNASGLPSVQAGARQIPQSLLNNVGRQIDKTRLTPTTGQVSQQTPGGSHIDFESMLQNALALQGGRPLPFQVGLVSQASGSLEVTIAEGRIFGRSDWVRAIYTKPGSTNPEPALGTAGINFAYAGPWSDAGAVQPEPVNNPKNVNKNGSSSSATQGSTTNGAPAHGHLDNGNLDESGKGSAYSNRPSGNAANITGNTSGTYHKVLQSGNAGTIITGDTAGVNGKLHSDIKRTTNRTP